MRKGLIVTWILLGLMVAFSFLAVWQSHKFESVNPEKNLTVDENGFVFQDEGLVGRFKPEGNSMNLKLVLAEPKDQESIINSIITVKFPGELAYSALQPRLVSIQGKEPFQLAWISPQDLRITMVGTLPDGYPTLIITAPDKYFQIPWYLCLIDFVIGWSLYVVLAISFVILGVLYLVMRHLSRPISWKGEQELSSAPRDLKPLELALLHHGQIRPIDLAAMLYDLAQRGYLQIVVHANGEPVFLRTSKEEGLLSYERFFLLLLFPDGSFPMTIREIMERVNKELFSSVVGQLYVEIYDGFSREGYFRDNPRQVHLRYKTAAIITQITGVIFSLFGFFMLRQIWLGSIAVGFTLYLAGFIVFYYGYKIVPLSKSGLILLKEEANFRLYLTESKPLNWAKTDSSLFYKLVPQAIVLDGINEWLARFREHTAWFVPDWYENLEAQTVTPEDFVQGVTAVGEYLGSEFAKMVDPNID